MRIQIPHKFELRQYQESAWEALTGGCKRAVCCWHRGAGKDLFALNYLIYMMMTRPGVYLHCFPTYNQGKRAIWSSTHLTDTGESMGYLDHIPEELIKHKNGSDMRVELKNGSIYCVMGIDGKNSTQARGMNPYCVIMSEYAFMDPESWRTLEPRVSQNNGIAIFLSTPNGQNHFYNLYNFANSEEGRKQGFYSSLLTIEDTGILSKQHVEGLRLEGWPEDFIQQEYYCSFTRGAQGSYYGKHIQRARDEMRICRVALLPDLPVYTAWDIGVGDSTAIWFYQVQSNGNVRILHYYENHGEGLEHYIRYLDRWMTKVDCVYRAHYVPHDMGVQEFGSGEKRIDTARRLGYTMTVVPKSRIDEGIQSVRALLPRCSFDEVECAVGITALDLYRKKWNDVLKVYSDEPMHDKYSHGADAFRYLACALKAFGSSGTLTKESINEMRYRNLGY